MDERGGMCVLESRPDLGSLDCDAKPDGGGEASKRDSQLANYLRVVFLTVPAGKAVFPIASVRLD
jgi:hypothetical protein